MKLQMLVGMGVIQCACLLLSAQTPGSAASQGVARPKTQPRKPAVSQPGSEDPGEKKFRENCGRCHNPPEELPTRITGTVLLHMRVRASLSAEDERAILHYLAP